MRMPSLNYCLDCDWNVSTEDYARSELADLAVKHATSTGHDIQSKYIPVDLDVDTLE